MSHIPNDFVYDCDKICTCKKPDWNDSLFNHELKKHCIHCDICGGVPNHSRNGVSR